MTEHNASLKEYARSKHVFIYEIAEARGVSEWTYVRYLRKPFSKEEAEAFKQTVDQIAARKEA